MFNTTVTLVSPSGTALFLRISFVLLQQWNNIYTFWVVWCVYNDWFKYINLDAWHLEFLAPIFKCQDGKFVFAKNSILKNTYTIQLKMTCMVLHMKYLICSNISWTYYRLYWLEARGSCTSSSTHCYVLMIVQWCYSNAVLLLLVSAFKVGKKCI